MRRDSQARTQLAQVLVLGVKEAGVVEDRLPGQFGRADFAGSERSQW